MYLLTQTCKLPKAETIFVFSVKTNLTGTRERGFPELKGQENEGF